MSRKTVFLSHSSKDIEKVRRIRDILEALDYEPLLFCLKCLDDDNENLETFIKKKLSLEIFLFIVKVKTRRNPLGYKKKYNILKVSIRKDFSPLISRCRSVKRW